MAISPKQGVCEWERAGLATSITTPREHDCDNNAVREPPTGASLESHYVHEEKLVGGLRQDPSLRCGTGNAGSSSSQLQVETGTPLNNEEKKKGAKERIEKFLTRFRPKTSDPEIEGPTLEVPSAPQKTGTEHFMISSGETPPVTPPGNPPGLEKREYPKLSPTLPTRQEEKAIALNNRTIAIKRNMRCLFGQEFDTPAGLRALFVSTSTSINEIGQSACIPHVDAKHQSGSKFKGRSTSDTGATSDGVAP